MYEYYINATINVLNFFDYRSDFELVASGEEESLWMAVSEHDGGGAAIGGGGGAGDYDWGVLLGVVKGEGKRTDMFFRWSGR